MKRRKQRKAAILLAVCMVLSVFTGIPVSATGLDETVDNSSSWVEFKTDDDTSEYGLSYTEGAESTFSVVIHRAAGAMLQLDDIVFSWNGETIGENDECFAIEKPDVTLSNVASAYTQAEDYTYTVTIKEAMTGEGSFNVWMPMQFAITDEDGNWTFDDEMADEGEGYSLEGDIYMVPRINGFAATNNIEYGEYGLTVSEHPQFSKEVGAELWGTTLYFAYITDEGTEPVGLDEISVFLGEDGKDIRDKVCTPNIENSQLINFRFDEVGEYTVKYQDSSVIIHVVYPEIGFYKGTETEDGEVAYTLLRNDGDTDHGFIYKKGAKDTFYMILHRYDWTKLDLENIKYTKDGEDITADINSYFNIEIPDVTLSSDASDYVGSSEDFVCSVTINEDITEDFYFGVKIPKMDVNENEPGVYTFGESYTISDSTYISLKLSGLAVTDQLGWDDEINAPSVPENPEFSQEVGADLWETTLYLAYITDEETESVALDGISVFLDGDETINLRDTVCAVKGMDDRLIDFTFDEVGEYTVKYRGSSVTIYVRYPEIGFYTKEDDESYTFLRNDRVIYTEGAEDTFYMILHRWEWSKLDLENIKYKKDGEDITANIASYFDIDMPELPTEASEYRGAENYYCSFTIKPDITEEFCFEVEIPKKELVSDEPEEGEEPNYTFIDGGAIGGSTNISLKINGLVATDWTEPLSWNESTGKLSLSDLPEGFSFSKRLGADIWGTTLYLGYLAEDEDGKETMTDVGLDDITVYYEGEAVGGAAEITASGENPKLINFTFYQAGTYTIKYNNSSVIIDVGLPDAGFYTSNEKSSDSLIREGISYTEGEDNTFYMILHRRECTKLNLADIKYTKDGEDFEDIDTYFEITPPEDVELSEDASDYANDTTDEYVYKFEMKEDALGSFWFGVSVPTLYIEGGDDSGYTLVEDEYPAECGVYVEFPTMGTLEDDNEHIGFAGCFITERAYENNSFYDSSSLQAQYWVHAETLQGVVDELMRCAGVGEVTVNGTKYKIENTGYIWANTSYFPKYEANAKKPQYLTTPSEVNGVIISSGEENYYTQDKNDVGTYYKVQQWVNADGDTTYTCTKDEEGDIDWDSIDWSNIGAIEDLPMLYPVTGDAEQGFAIEQGASAKTISDMMNDGYMYNWFKIVCEWPELHVDATTSVKLGGNFGEAETGKPNVYLGLYADSEDIRSEVLDHTGDTDEENLLRVITKDDIGENIVVEEKGITIKVTEMKAKMAPTVTGNFIKKEDITLKEEGKALRDKIDIEGIIAEDEALKQALIDGESLDVSLAIGEVEEEPEAPAVKEAVDKISAELKKIKDFTSKIQYLDLNLNYKVGTKEGNITETKGEITISIELPEDFAKAEKESAKSWKPVVYRYHDRVAEKLTGTTWEDGKLTFGTDKFSVYAVAIEEVVPTGIEITEAPTKTSYAEGEKFDKTGMEVEVTYSDNTKKKITDYTVPDKALTKADEVVTIEYDGLEAEQAITVTAKETPATPTTPENPTNPAKPGDPVTVNGNNYTVTSAEGSNKSVTYTGGSKTAKQVVVPATVTVNGTEYKVTAIANNAFSGCKKLTAVTIGKNVTSIGDKAFYQCTALKKVTIPANVTKIGKQAFSGCKKLATVTLGKNVTSIGDKAFYQCTALKKITIPAKVNKIGKQAFYGCKNLKTITIKTSKLTSKNVGSKAFKGISSKATIKVPKKKLASYKKLLKSKGAGSKVKIKK
ncbi:MAG: leucine-rich repeat domain-containing protein [Bacteroidales bacterium]|nr:leucine-rich repeat domain-containing protein [Clostridium sp.]MCM1203911.1 leucine-rich repeat domain-containing protein [Bacteroidales bacterium]